MPAPSAAPAATFAPAPPGLAETLSWARADELDRAAARLARLLPATRALRDDLAAAVRPARWVLTEADGVETAGDAGQVLARLAYADGWTVARLAETMARSEVRVSVARWVSAWPGIVFITPARGPSPARLAHRLGVRLRRR